MIAEPLDLPTPDPAELDGRAALAEHSAASHQRIADESMSRAATLRALAGALRILGDDVDAQQAAVAISGDGWTGTAGDLAAVARALVR